MDTDSKKGKLFVISGPSGVGKTTLAESMLMRLGKKYSMQRVITYTTRAPRGSEVAGLDYHYVSVNDFKDKLASGFFIEHSEAYGNYYGSPRCIINDINKGKSFIMVVDQVGAYKIKEQYQEAVLVWVVPPTLNDLKDRLYHRNSDLESDINRRLGIARRELEQEAKLRIFDYMVVNEDLGDAKKNLEQIMLAELQGVISINS